MVTTGVLGCHTGEDQQEEGEHAARERWSRCWLGMLWSVTGGCRLAHWAYMPHDALGHWHRPSHWNNPQPDEGEGRSQQKPTITKSWVIPAFTLQMLKELAKRRLEKTLLLFAGSSF